MSPTHFLEPLTPATPLDATTSTLVVDGRVRPVRNNRGQPLHWSEEGVRNFWRWFGDSKAVDGDGRPLVVYHATNEKFTEFKAGEKDGLSGRGIYFSEYPLGQFGSNVMSVYLRIHAPITRQTEKPGKREVNSAGIPTKMVSDVLDQFPEFDGVINRMDITVKSPSQIKSATDNSGLFDPRSNRIDDPMDRPELAASMRLEIEGSSSMIVEVNTSTLKAVEAALIAANTELARQAKFEVAEVLRDIEMNGNGADSGSLVADERYWDAENEQFTDAGFAELDRLNQIIAEERAGFRQVVSLDELNSAHQTAQVEAFVAYAEALGAYVEKDYSSGGSRYANLRFADSESQKFRFADHFNTKTSNDLAPDFNVAPGHCDFTEAIDKIEQLWVAHLKGIAPSLNNVPERPATGLPAAQVEPATLHALSGLTEREGGVPEVSNEQLMSVNLAASPQGASPTFDADPAIAAVQSRHVFRDGGPEFYRMLASSIATSQSRAFHTARGIDDLARAAGFDASWCDFAPIQGTNSHFVGKLYLDESRTYCLARVSLNEAGQGMLWIDENPVTLMDDFTKWSAFQEMVSQSLIQGRPLSHATTLPEYKFWTTLASRRPVAGQLVVHAECGPGMLVRDARGEWGFAQGSTQSLRYDLANIQDPSWRETQEINALFQITKHALWLCDGDFDAASARSTCPTSVMLDVLAHAPETALQKPENWNASISALAMVHFQNVLAQCKNEQALRAAGYVRSPNNIHSLPGSLWYAGGPGVPEPGGLFTDVQAYGPCIYCIEHSPVIVDGSTQRWDTSVVEKFSTADALLAWCQRHGKLSEAGVNYGYD